MKSKKNKLIKLKKISRYLFYLFWIFIIFNCNQRRSNNFKLIYASNNIDSASLRVEDIDSLKILTLSCYLKDSKQFIRKLFLLKKNKYYEQMYLLNIMNKSNQVIDTFYCLMLSLRDTVILWDKNKIQNSDSNKILVPPDLFDWKYTIFKVRKNLYKTVIEGVSYEDIYNNNLFLEEIYYDSLFNIKYIFINHNDIKLSFIKTDENEICFF